MNKDSNQTKAILGLKEEYERKAFSIWMETGKVQNSELLERDLKTTIRVYQKVVKDLEELLK